MHCNVCNVFWKSKKAKISHNFENIFILSDVYSKCGHEYEKKFKEEKSVEILKTVGLINNIEELTINVLKEIYDMKDEIKHSNNKYACMMW